MNQYIGSKINLCQGVINGIIMVIAANHFLAIHPNLFRTGQNNNILVAVFPLQPVGALIPVAAFHL